jgi:hypothetical protein
MTCIAYPLTSVTYEYAVPLLAITILAALFVGKLGISENKLSFPVCAILQRSLKKELIIMNSFHLGSCESHGVSVKCQKSEKCYEMLTCRPHFHFGSM